MAFVPVWFPTSPLKSVQAKAPGVSVQFNSGSDPSAAAELAKKSDVAIVFAYQWESEDMDLPSLSLPENQDELIAKVAAANPHTVVVLETGGPVTMPWAGQVGAILEAWYAGSKGSDAVANVLFGAANPAGKLPMTFPRSEADLPHPTLVKPPADSIPNRMVRDPWNQIAAGLAVPPACPLTTEPPLFRTIAEPLRAYPTRPRLSTVAPAVLISTSYL